MTIDSTKFPQTTPSPDTATAARTDDLLASGAETQDGARGFETKADPGALQTGMEGIAGATVQQGNRETGSGNPAITGTVQDNAGQVQNKQGT